MKKFFISAFLLCSGVLSYAQLLSVESIDKVTLPDGGAVTNATISPDGSFVVLSEAQKPGLQKLVLANNAMSQISENGIGSDVQISADGTTIVYREASYQGKLRYVSLKSVNTATGMTKTLVSPTRNFQGFAVAGASVSAVDNGRASTQSLSSVGAVAVPTASIDHGQLCITIGNRTANISPQGKAGQSYLWPSISPDGKKVVYYLATVGAYVCNLDGSNPMFIGAIRAPRWYNNDIVVGMNDQDNGSYVTSSSIIAVKADGTATQQLTDDDAMAMYPTASSNAGKISYITPAGELYIINLK